MSKWKLVAMAVENMGRITLEESEVERCRFMNLQLRSGDVVVLLQSVVKMLHSFQNTSARFNFVLRLKT